METNYDFGMKGVQKVTFKDAKIVPGSGESAFNLKVTYEIETLREILELTFPNIDMWQLFPKSSLPNVSRNDVHSFCWDIIGRMEHNKNECFIPFEYDILPVIGSSREFRLPIFSDGMKISNGYQPPFIIRKIKDKTKEMTVEEVEKALGYKVKIISDEGEE